MVGNHTETHCNDEGLDCSKLNADDFLEYELIPTEEAIEQATGVKPRYFRFPGGSADCEVKGAAEERGYAVVGWHIDTADWCFASGKGYCKVSWLDEEFRNDFMGYTLSQLRSKKQGGIMLMHDIHSFTVGQLDELLTTIEGEGFTFTTLDDTESFPNLNAGL